MRFRQASLRINDQTYPLQPNRANTFDEIYADFQQRELDKEQGVRYSVFLHPKQKISLQRLEIQFDMPLPPDAQFLANGYQSWSESRFLKVSDGIPGLRALAKKRPGFLGDAHIMGIPRGRGKLHSWTYTLLRNEAVSARFGEQASSIFLGSLNERTGFTLFLYDHAEGVLTVRKDLDNLSLQHSFPALDFWIGEGREQALFEQYFTLAEVAPPKAAPVFGWTSGERLSSQLSASVLLEKLESFSGSLDQHQTDKQAASGSSFKLPEPAQAHFVIDDGWQTAVGDWLSAKPAFPGGMRPMALKIKEKGLQPGLWIAPFVVSSKAEIVRKNPDWLLKDVKGQPLRAGWNPSWGGWFHALDFYHDGVREYLTGMFHMALEKWGFELLKLDYLFAVTLAPPPGKTRGAVMWEAMEFLRRLLGNRQMIACGVPLGASFGMADYCGIGGAAQMAWQHPWHRFLRHRERVDALSALHSMLSLWQLNGRAFQSATDGFSLQSEHSKLSPEQQHTFLTINALLGNLLYTSDDLSMYSEGQKSELEEALLLRGSRVKRVFEREPAVWEIDFEQDETQWMALCNLSPKEKTLPLANGMGAALRPYETFVLKVV
jgi:alpha-galactosidase